MQRAPHALNRGKTALLLQRVRNAGRSMVRANITNACSSASLKLIDEIAKLAVALGKRNAFDQHRRTNSCSYPEILLELRTGPDRKARNTRFGCRRANLAEVSAAREPG